MNRKISKKDELLNILKELIEACVDLKITEYSNSLYTEYEECYYDNDKTTFSLRELDNRKTSYELLDVIRKVISLSFDWDYKCMAKFDVNLSGSSLSIKFYEPVIKYVISDKTFDIQIEEEL